MHDELTSVDIRIMREELGQLLDQMPALMENVARTREFGDLGENDEYKSAKRAINAARRRIRFLENMIATAVVIDPRVEEGKTALFDYIHISYPEEGFPESEWETRVVRVVTTLRNDATRDCISKESPVGKALLGRKPGEIVTIRLPDRPSYQIRIDSFERGDDDPNLPLAR